MDLPRLRRPGRSLAIVLLLLGAAFFGLILQAPRAAAATNYVYGPIVASTSWSTGDTYVLTGNVTVKPGVTLTIDPGVTVLANPAVRLFVEGRLLANGTAGNLISFDTNRTGVPWGGVQFNKTSTGSFLQYASLYLMETGVRATQASPTISHVVIDHAFLGVQLEGSSAWVSWSTINYTGMAVWANGSGSPVIVANTITTVLGNPAIAILVTNVNQITVQSNTIRWVNGTDGRTPALMGARGTDGGEAVGILVSGSAWANLAGNTVDRLVGGRGGDGQGSTAGNGGAGGAGGSVVALVIANTPYSRMQNNFVTNLVGGHGGNGGGSTFAGALGGPGGAGGDIYAVQTMNATTLGWWFYNTVNGATGGPAGNGGSSSSGSVGRGGHGGSAYGFFLTQALDGNASNNNVQNVRGGYGGNSTNLANGLGGGFGGEAAGIWMLGTDGTSRLSSNTISSLTGGTGGAGYTAAGGGGNATGLLFVGDGDAFNGTTVTGNTVSSSTGGVGGLGTRQGGDGGNVSGIAAFRVNVTSSSNTVQSLTGGAGGPVSINTFPAGRGGDAVAMAFALVPLVSSSRDRFQSTTGGSPGSGGTAPPPSYGVGFYGIGNGSLTTRSVLGNASFGSNGNYDLYLDNYSETTTVNTTFSGNKLAIQAAASLTVQNFLAVKAFWPDNVTAVSGVTITVLDGATAVYNGTSSSGSVQWIVVTNRVYLGGTTPTWNTTQSSVGYQTDTFANNPRTVNMTASQTQYFTMADTMAPTSSANPLPAWTGTRSFTVHYGYSDGNGVGVSNVTLWYRVNATAWVAYATQVAISSGTGQFAFTAPGDGTYEFATTAIDKADNEQTPRPPVANNSWTIVDTTKPSSHANPLPAWETSLSFTVSWAPDPGVTDIASYMIQYNVGAAWVTWLGDTSSTLATFTATSQGVYQFRSIASDRAGNVEIAPAGNDTWTIVDTIPPGSTVQALPPYETNLTFSVSWGPIPGTADAASYQIQVSDNGGAWTAWMVSPSSGTASFSGTDGHRYAFRSVATDYAGNAESKGAANDTWTFVDVSAPRSAVAALPPYETTLSFSIAWAPAIGVTDVSTYTIYVSDDGGGWAPVSGLIGTAATSTSFAGVDGHVYAFRSIARDFGGNLETKASGNDTYTRVDVTRPFVVSDAPEGAGTNATPAITVTFSEAMDEASVQQAFSIAPSMNGAFLWSPDGRVMTYLPARALQPSTTYVVTIDTSAKDLAGNGLAAPKNFNFTTSASTAGGFSLGDLWPILAAVTAAVAGAILFLVFRRRGASEAASAAATKPDPAAAAPAVSQAAIDDVFLLYGRDGVLIKHETRRLRPDIDTDILSGMLTAVQQFVKDSFRGEEGEELNEMTVGQMHILIGRGKYLILAAMVTGGDTSAFTNQIRKCIQDMEDHHWDQLEDWDGDMAFAKVLAPYVKKLIRGEYP